MNKTDLLTIILAVNGGLWLVLAAIDWIAVRLTRYRADGVHDKEDGHGVPPAHAH